MLITQISLAAFQVTIDCCNSRHPLKVSVFSVFTPINCFRCAFVRCCTTFWKSYNRDAHNLRTRHVAVTVSILWFARQLLSVLFTVIPGDWAYAHITSEGEDWNTEGKNQLQLKKFGRLGEGGSWIVFVTWLTGWGIRLNLLFVCDFVALFWSLCVYTIWISARL